MKPLFNNARIKERPSSFEPSCAPFSTKGTVNLRSRSHWRENWAVYNGLTNGETRLAILRALALMSVEIGDDFTGLLDDRDDDDHDDSFEAVPRLVFNQLSACRSPHTPCA